MLSMEKKYTPTIGLEIHAELNTKTKMFCGCTNQPHVGSPNEYTCPVCTAQPGSLPVVNAAAIESVLKVGHALGASIATYSEFDRKNYFYPDIPKAYQISQYAYPLVTGGELAGVAITRVHLEEDTARSQHDQGVGSVVDFNRAGVPLMELVTEPVIHDVETARSFAQELQLMLRMLGVSAANMERGEMRVEANISVSADRQLGTKVEVKNLNSFKAVESAIRYEIDRQVHLLESGETIIQETRGWDEFKLRTFSQRSKETAHDYRYFPDPDITKFSLQESSQFNNSRISEIIPELATPLRDKWVDHGLSSDLVEVLLKNEILRPLAISIFDELSDNTSAIKLAANYLTSDVLPLINESVDDRSMNTTSFIALMKLLDERKITSRVAKDLLPEIVFSECDPASIASERGLLQQSNADDLLPIVKAIILENQLVVEEYRSGKETALKFLLGQGMKATKGSADPIVLQELLQQEISK